MFVLLLFSKWQFLPFIEKGLTNYARVDLCNVGGFTEAMKVAGWAEAHYIDCMCVTLPYIYYPALHHIYIYCAAVFTSNRPCF